MSNRPAGVWAESAQRNKDPTPQGVPAFHVLCVSLLLYNYSKALVSSGQFLRLHPLPILTQIRQWTMEEEKISYFQQNQGFVQDCDDTDWD